MEIYKRYPVLAGIENQISNAFELLKTCYANGGKVLAVGNGGSCADADHIVAELMKGFAKKRPLSSLEKNDFAIEDLQIADKLQIGLPAINICAQNALVSAFSNDVVPELAYAQVAYNYARKGDVLVAFSTSGNSKNVLNAVKAVKAKGAKVIAFTGEKESELSRLSDITINAPETETYKVQELHLPIYHYLCLKLEDEFFSE